MNFNPRTHMGCEGADGKGYGYQTPYGRGYKAKDFTASQINQMAWGEKAFSRWKELGLDVGSRFALKFISLQDNKQCVPLVPFQSRSCDLL